MTIYNAGPYLKPAADSLLAQTFQDFEFIAVENGSTDGSKNVVAVYKADPRVKVIDLAENIGRVPALNAALSQACGDYIAILDADDIAHPERLAEQVAVLDVHPEIVMVSSHARFIDEVGHVTGYWRPACAREQLLDALAYENPFSHSACTFRRKAAVAAGSYSIRYPIANDLALWIALSHQGELAMIERPLADIRSHSGNTTNASIYAVSRFREELELYRIASALPGVSEVARRSSLVTQSRLHFNIAKGLLAARRPFGAAAELSKCFLRAPLFFVRHMTARIIPAKSALA